MKLDLRHLVSGLFLVFSLSCQKEDSSGYQERDFPPNRVNQPVQGGKPGEAYGARDEKGDIVIVDWQGNILKDETDELIRYAKTGVQEDQYSPAVGSSDSGSNKHFSSTFAEGETLTSTTDGWKLAGDVVRSPEFWKLVGKAVDYANDSEAKPVHVDSYTDKNGREVSEHYRSKPDQ